MVRKFNKATYKRVKPHRIYTTSNVKLLEKTDELRVHLSEDATKEILRREYEKGERERYIMYTKYPMMR